MERGWSDSISFLISINLYLHLSLLSNSIDLPAHGLLPLEILLSTQPHQFFVLITGCTFFISTLWSSGTILPPWGSPLSAMPGNNFVVFAGMFELSVPLYIRLWSYSTPLGEAWRLTKLTQNSYVRPVDLFEQFANWMSRALSFAQFSKVVLGLSVHVYIFQTTCMSGEDKFCIDLLFWYT